MNLFKKTLINIKLHFNAIQWLKDFYLYQPTPVLNSLVNLENFTINNGLLIAPHADDELISSYSLLKSKNKKIAIFYCGLTGSRDDIENSLIRKNEITKFAQQNKNQLIHANNNIECHLQECITRNKYDVILLPSYIDWHTEHRLINHVLSTIKSCIPVNTVIIWYTVTIPFSHTMFNAYSVLSLEDQKQKWKLFTTIYISQKMPITRMKIHEKINGKLGNCYACEAFHLFKNVNEWSILVSKLQQIDDHKFKILAQNINTIKSIRRIVNATNWYEK